MRKRNDTKVRTTRFYVEKSNGKLRPIGAPKSEWKVILAGWAWLMSVFLGRPRNHGFTPGRGIWTAWRTVIDKVIPSKYIYEFDLSKCFNSIRLEGHNEGLDYIIRDSGLYELLSLESILKKLDVPKDVVDQLVKFNQNTPKLGNTEFIDKKDPELWEVINTKKDELALVLKEGMYDSVFRPQGLMQNDSFGFTQGSPLSPILTVLCLEHWRPLWNPTWDTTMYADDGIFSTNKDYIEIGNEKVPWPVRDPLDKKWNSKNEKSFDLGVKFNPSKSGWVKQDGKFLKPLTFLGCTYDPESNLLSNGEYSVSIDGIDDLTLKKLVGKVYGSSTQEEWDWKVKEKSLIWRLNQKSPLWQKLVIFFKPNHLLSGYNKWDQNLPIREASTIGCALLIHGLSSRGNLFRKVRS